MKIISHRGNISGPNRTNENKPEYIIEAAKHGFDVEVDLWMIKNNLFLGHDKPQFKIKFNFLIEQRNKLWIHCKNLRALSYLNSYKKSLNYFWHEKDSYTLTSNGYIWTYPNQNVDKNCIIVLLNENEKPPKCFGICSDYPIKYLR